jgi:hypothetical protein
MTPFDNKLKKQKMEEFLTLHFKTLNQLVGETIEEVEISEEEINVQGKLDYKSEDELEVLGFNYSPGDIERDYFFSICCWMAVTSGKQKKFDSNETKPFIIYDGYENYALFVNEKTPVKVDFEWIEVNENAYRLLPTLARLNQNSKLKKLEGKKYVSELELIDSLIKQELERLTNEWKKIS